MLQLQQHTLRMEELWLAVCCRHNVHIACACCSFTRRFGPNALTPPKKPGFFAKLWAQLNNVLIFILLAAAVVVAGLQECKFQHSILPNLYSIAALQMRHSNNSLHSGPMQAVGLLLQYWSPMCQQQSFKLVAAQRHMCVVVRSSAHCFQHWCLHPCMKKTAFVSRDTAKAAGLSSTWSAPCSSHRGQPAPM